MKYIVSHPLPLNPAVPAMVNCTTFSSSHSAGLSATYSCESIEGCYKFTTPLMWAVVEI